MPGPDAPRPYQAVQPDRAGLDAAEQAVTDAARRALDHYLTVALNALLHGDTTGLTAAPEEPEQQPPQWQLWPTAATWATTVARFLTSVIRDVFTTGWRAVMGDRAEPDQHRDTYVDAALAGLAESTFPDDVYDAARRAAFTADEEGDTPDQLRQRVTAVFDPDQWDDRADMIGRTEANGAFNTASWDAGNARQDLFGEQLWKTWLATNDQRTRDDHRRIDGAVVPSGDTFDVGGAAMRYPHDPFGPIGQIANCRCALAWVQEDEVAELQQRYEEMLPNQTDPWGNPVAADAGTPDTTTAADGDEDADDVTGQSGMPRALERYWTNGEGGRVKIRWGTDGAFRRCVNQLNQYVRDPKGTCANLEHEATGHWPAEQVVESAATDGDCGCTDATGEPELTAGVSGASDLPLAGESVDWSGSAAKKALGNWAKGDASKLRKGFFWRDPDGDPTSVSTYKLPFAKPVNGELKAVPAGVQAAAAAIQGSRGGVDIPQADVPKVRSRIAGYYKKMGRTPPWKENGGSSPSKAASAATAAVEVDAPTVADEDRDEQPQRGEQPRAQTWAELVASSVPAQPPEAWFTDPQLSAPMKVRVLDNGMVVGHIAAWHTEHASLPGVNPPRDPYGGIYPRFHRHGVRTAEGGRIKTGPLSTGPSGHADLYDPLGAVIDHYDDPSYVAADVRIGEDDHGIWVSGSLRPGVSPEQVWMLDRYSISGDWRDDELVAACTVAVPGFHLDDSDQVNPLAASASLPPTLVGAERTRREGDHTAALVAAGIIHPTERHAPPASAAQVDGWSLYRQFKAAATTDRRLRAARHRLHGSTPASGGEDGEHDPDPDLATVAAILGWNPALHPRDARGRFTDSPGGGSSSDSGGSSSSGTSGGSSGNESGLSDTELENRIGHLQRALARATPTDGLYQNADETWVPERARQHDAIINDLYARAADVPNEGKALVSGGLGGAGKSHTLKNHLGISEGDYLTVNPDDIKEEMAQRGMIPDLEGLSPMEASSLVHEESSHIAKQLAKRAYQDNKNMIWDITMGSPGSVEKRLNDLRSNGYDKVSAVFVDIPIETSVQRAMGRYERGIADWNNGKGQGGRYVPPEVIRENHAPGWTSENRKTFEQLKPRFDAWALYDSSQLPSRKVDGRGEVS